MYSSMVTVDLGMIGVERAEKNEKIQTSSLGRTKKNYYNCFFVLLLLVIL